MTMAAVTGMSDVRACSKCGIELLHREFVAEYTGPAKTWWSPDGHIAPCGLPCMTGGVKPAQIRGDGVHGYGDRCPRCGPLRVLPEVVAEMRKHLAWVERYVGADPEATKAAFIAVSKHLYSALDEIDKLTRERDEARRLLGASLETARALSMRLADMEIATDEAKEQER